MKSKTILRLTLTVVATYPNRYLLTDSEGKFYEWITKDLTIPVNLHDRLTIPFKQLTEVKYNE